jgi:hypothetical protein
MEKAIYLFTHIYVPSMFSFIYLFFFWFYVQNYIFLSDLAYPH